MSDEALLSLADVELCVISAADTHALRLAVLRSDVPTKEVVFAEDDLPGVEHLGLRVHGELVAISSWVPRPHEGEAAVQLRGMATAKRLQSHGLGGCGPDASAPAKATACWCGPGPATQRSTSTSATGSSSRGKDSSTRPPNSPTTWLFAVTADRFPRAGCLRPTVVV
jgi:hypothetical protein